LIVLGGKARRAEYFAAKAEGKLEEAGFIEKPPVSSTASKSLTQEPIRNRNRNAKHLPSIIS
jgi:hypothetical protein